MFNLLDLQKQVGLEQGEVETLGFTLSMFPELSTVLEKVKTAGVTKDYTIPVEVIDALGVDYFDELIKETKENVDKKSQGYSVPNEVVDALGVGYFDELVDETKSAIGSTATQSSDAPVQQQGEDKEE